MSVIKGFFFDMDGTLVDTYQADYLSYHQAILDVTGVDVSKEDYLTQNGKEIRQKLAHLLPGLPEDQVQAIAERKKQIYPDFLDHTVPNQELIGFLQLMARTPGTVIALVTTAKEANARAVLRRYDLSDLFSYIVHGGEVSNHKPHSEIYQLALQRTGLNPEEVVAFEDTETGAESARGAGIACVKIDVESFSDRR